VTESPSFSTHCGLRATLLQLEPAHGHLEIPLCKQPRRSITGARKVTIFARLAAIVRHSAPFPIHSDDSHVLLLWFDQASYVATCLSPRFGMDLYFFGPLLHDSSTAVTRKCRSDTTAGEAEITERSPSHMDFPYKEWLTFVWSRT